MKKLLALITVLALLCGAAACEAYTWQDVVDAMDDATLQSVTVFLQSEVVRRLGEGFDLDAGIYWVGEDIPAGRWTVELLPESVTGEVTVYADDAFFTDPLTMFVYSQGLGEYTTKRIGLLILTAGSYIQVKGRVHFSPYTGIK